MKKKLLLLHLLVATFFAHAQNVGIGTPAPQAKLHILSANNEALRLDAANPFLSLYSSGVYKGYFWISPISIEIGSAATSNLPITFAPNGYQLMYIGTNGNVGIGTISPNASALLDASSTTKGFLPPRMSQSQRDLISPVEGLIVFNITTKKPNYHDGTAWRNFDGTCANTVTLTIGDNYQGGKVAYILQPGDPGYVDCIQHGLIAASSDQSTGIQWYNGSFTTTGATGVAIGTGNANTNIIVASQGAGSYAAQLCADLVLGGYSDWYLPSKDELLRLYVNRVAIGGFSSSYYWSSSEGDANYASSEDFTGGLQNFHLKNVTNRVRAVRAF